MEAIIAALAVLVGLIVGFLLGSRTAGRGEQARREELASRLTDASATLAQRDVSLQQAGQQVARLETQLEEREKSLQTAADLKKEMQQVFAEVAQTHTARSSEEFLKLAQARFETLTQESQGQLATREEAIKGLVDPLTQLLTQYDKALQEMELKRQSAYVSLDERLKTLAEAETNLQRETGRLVSALRRPEVRGQWGEMQLRNAVELAGMSEYCDFVEQEHMEGGGGAQRPDMIVRLPGNRSIIVDAKVPLKAYLDALECEDLDTRQRLLDDHARQCRTHLDSLAAKRYWDNMDSAPDCVVMFIPGESLFAAAVEADPELIGRGLKNRVMIATPSTLIAMLYAVHYGWQQQVFTENAEVVRALASEMYDRLGAFGEHFQKVGKNLNQSVNAFNSAAGSLERRVLVSARKLREMGVHSKKDLPELEPIDTVAQVLTPELTAGTEDGEEAAEDTA